jgi:type II secretory pathway pseudopilin PulG
MRRQRRHDGFTLVDFAMTLAVFAILSTLTVPPVISTVETYRRNLAVRHVLGEIRHAQSLAITRGETFALQWGGAPSIGLSPGHYRIVRDTTGSCSLPPQEAPVDGTDVVRGWFDLTHDYPAVTIASLTDASGDPVSAVMFDTLGASINPCTTVSFPLTITIADGSGAVETIEVGRSGLARLTP